MKDTLPDTENQQLHMSRGYVQPFIDFRNTDGVAGMATIKTSTVKCVLVDPPYLYLKGQKLEREFDEFLYFSKVRRVLRDDGFIVMFGRGASFYRWNGFLETLGFKFKEEIIWDKSYGSSPLMAITRCHETISIWTKKTGVIKKVKIPYEVSKGYDLESIHRDIKRIKTIVSNKSSFEALEKYLENGQLSFDGGYKESTTITSGRKRVDRVVSTAQMIIEGMNEKSIIKSLRDHYTSIHPTQKPVDLLKRLINITTEKGDLIVDNFAGSASCGEASAELERNWIGWEIDKEYYDLAINKRLKNTAVQVSLF